MPLPVIKHTFVYRICYCLLYSVHDKSFKRWMPHINLLYPFIKDESDGRAFDEAESAIRSAVAELQPFQIVFDRNSFRTFRHGKNFTLWLKPVSETTSAGKFMCARVCCRSSEEDSCNVCRIETVELNVAKFYSYGSGFF
jgi:hypothetical protein